MSDQLTLGGCARHVPRQFVPGRSSPVREQPPGSCQAETWQLEYSRAGGGGPCPALGHSATRAKHGPESSGGRRHVQCAKYVHRVTPRDHLSHTGPAERSEGGADAIILTQPRDQACREMYDALQSVQT